jgi:hypothetical protein
MKQSWSDKVNASTSDKRNNIEEIAAQTVAAIAEPPRYEERRAGDRRCGDRRTGDRRKDHRTASEWSGVERRVSDRRVGDRRTGDRRLAGVGQAILLASLSVVLNPSDKANTQQQKSILPLTLGQKLAHAAVTLGEGSDLEIGGFGSEAGKFNQLRDMAFDGQNNLYTLEGFFEIL